MLTYILEKEKGRPLYLSLYEKIKASIKSQELKPQEKLPSKRAFARHLGVSVVTVQTAYSHLLAEGYIYSEEKKGYYVNHLPFLETLGVEKASLPPKKASQPEKKAPSPTIDLCQNTVNGQAFPFSTWSKLMRKNITENHVHLLEAVPGMGLLKLRQAISQHLFHFAGFHAEPEQILIGAGSEYLYGLIVKLLGAHKKIAIEDPGYLKIRQIYQAENAQVIPLPLDEKGLSLNALKNSAAEVAHLSPSHHFPSGVFMPISRRLELLNWLKEESGRYLIEDDFDSEFCWNNKPIPPLASLDQTGHTLYLNTFSKTVSPALRISYMVLPPQLVARYQEKLGFYSCTVSNFQQYTLAEFIEEGYFERHINRMKKRYQNLEAQLTAIIQKSPLSEIAEIAKNPSGLHFTLCLKTTLATETIREKARARGLRLTFLEDFTLKQPLKKHPVIIVNYAALTPNILKKAIEILEDILLLNK